MPFNPPVGNTQTGNAVNLYELASSSNNPLVDGEVVFVSAQQTGTIDGATAYSGYTTINFETFTVPDPNNPSQSIPLPSGQYCITQLVYTNNSINAQVRVMQQQTVVTWNAEQYQATKNKPAGPDVCLSGYATQGSLNGWTWPSSIATANCQSAINGVTYNYEFPVASQAYGPINSATSAITIVGEIIGGFLGYIGQGCMTYLGPNNNPALASFNIVTPPYNLQA